MNYANKKGVKFVVLAGESEIAKNEVTVKNMESGEQISIEANLLIS